MKILKYVLGIIVVLVILFMAGGMLLPSEQHVERSVVIEADSAEVFALVSDLRAFNEWSPWADIDPDGTVYEFSGPATGVGSKVKWSSEHPNVGTGTQEIIEFKPNSMVKTELRFEGFDTPSYGSFKLEPADGGTRVTWAFDANFDNMIGRWMGLMMDNWVGGDYERGLERLKKLAES